MQDMDHSFDQTADAADYEDYAFGQGPMKPFVDGARFFCLAFAFIVPNILLINHVWGF